MKETYKVSTPKQIKFGDPWYYEQYSGKELERLVVDLKPPAHFETKVVLEENTYEEYPDFKDVSMSIFLAPKQIMDTFLQGKMYASEVEFRKEIGVDTAKYDFQVDDRDDTINTAADGLWGSYQEFNRTVGGKKITDAVIITAFFPDEETFDDVRQHLKYFFPDAEQTENVEPPEEEPIQEDDSPKMNM